MDWTTGSFASDGEDIHFEVTGSSERTIVFSHGLGGNHAVWFQQAPVFAEHFRVVTWDQRGFGLSTNRAKASGPAAAVTNLRALLDHLGVARAHLVGQSMGGWATLGFALGSRERVSSIVLADTTAGLLTPGITEVMTSAVRRQVPEGTVGAHPAIGPDLDTTKGFLYQQLGGFKGDLDDAEMIGKLFTTSYDVEAARALGLPTLCVVGADDDLIPPAAVREVAAVLGADCIEIPGAGHSPYFEQPSAWNEAVLEFVRRLD